MNSAEEISKYKETIASYYSPTLSRRLIGYGYDLPEKSPKKDKKWSIGSLFRRKKKEDGESSSDEESQKRSFLGRRRKKSEKKRKAAKTVGTFDHVVFPRNPYHNSNGYDEAAIFSDPTVQTKALDYVSNSRSSVASSESFKKCRKGLTKVRAEARRTNIKRDSSSDEDSQRSASSSRLKSDDSLHVNRKSRTARTERYLKRHSKDGENPKDYLRVSKSDAEYSYMLWKTSDESNRSPSRSPLVSQVNISGLSTIPPSHGSRMRVSNSTSNPSYKPPLSMNEYNHRKLLNNQRSVSCDADIHKPEVVHVTKPRYRNLSLIEPRQVIVKQPPPPPPRDPRRLVTAQYYEARPSTCYVDQTRFQGKTLNVNCRSTSEDHLPKNPVQLMPRPSSATPEASRHQTKTEIYNYLTDKKPRSRKPILIQSNSGAQKALDFWKRKDKENAKKTPEPEHRQMFTSQTHVQTQVFLPSVLHNDINSNSTDSLLNENIRLVSPFQPIPNDEEIKRKSANLEEALDELEAIYNSLRLGDEDLLERAEQREEAAMRQNGTTSRGALSDSGFSYEPFGPRRKRPTRRSQTVDRKWDDMAYRKLNKERSATIGDPQSCLSQISYLNASPVYGTPPTDNPGKPDLTLDDVVYRNVKFSNSSPKIIEPQPPFGIPLGPITLASNSDYLHVVPDNRARPSFRPRKIPNIVNDDLAFRNLRKDDGKEPALKPFDNNNLEMSLKKKRAVRSLSANIGSLCLKLNDNDKKTLTDYNDKRKLTVYNDKRKLSDDNDKNELTHVADAMEIARQVLKDKESRLRRGFLSDTDTENGNESRMNFLNSLKDEESAKGNYLHAKPPRGSTPDLKLMRSPRESTPIAVSPPEEARDSSLDDLLTALATEARETNERITNELKHFSSVSGPQMPIHNQTCDKLVKGANELKHYNSVSGPQMPIHNQTCEKVVEGADLEEVEHITVEPVATESVANVVLTRPDEPESDHDYENLTSDHELNLDVDVVVECTSPFEEHKAELIATFQELKKNVDATEELGKNQAGEVCVGVVDGVTLQAYPSNTNDVETNRSALDNKHLEASESLKSPRLVLETSKFTIGEEHRRILENQSMICRSAVGVERGGLGAVDEAKPTATWYRDPTTMAVACSYGIACAHQLASLDFVAILGILFAVLSFIAALIF